MNKPNLFIVGGRKCGTTSLYSSLKPHPEVFMPRWKEPHFFGSDIHSRPSFTRDDYLALFSKSGTAKRIGEASTGYLFSKLASREIREFNPESKIIIMLRNPVDALYSLHSEYVHSAVEQIEDFESALKAETRRKQERYLPPPAVPMEFLFYREWVAYAEQTRRYFETFGRENVRVTILDDFQTDAAGELQRILCFLGLRTDFQAKSPLRNPNKVVRSRALQKFLVDPSRPFARLARRVPGNALVRALVRMNTKHAPRPRMRVELRQRLNAELLSEVERLSHLLNRDLMHWCKRENDEPAKDAVDSAPINSIVVV